MRNFRVIFVLFFLLFFTQVLVAAKLEKEFTFTLPPGEISKDWEVNVPLSANESGKFLGRDFKPIFSDPAYSFQVVKEALTDNNYYVKVRLFKISNVANPPSPAVLQVAIQIGDGALDEPPKTPTKIHFYLAKLKEVEWKNWSSSETAANSAKYLSYVFKIADTGEVIEEQVVPVYLTGPRFTIHSVFPQNKKIIFTFQASNTSAKYSLPKSGHLQIGSFLLSS